VIRLPGEAGPTSVDLVEIANWLLSVRHFAAASVLGQACLRDLGCPKSQCRRGKRSPQRGNLNPARGIAPGTSFQHQAGALKGRNRQVCFTVIVCRATRPQNSDWTPLRYARHFPVVLKHKRKRLILYACLTAAIAAVVYYVTRPAEPQFAGKSLSYWVENIWADKEGAQLESAEAFRQMGANAVPHLIRMLGEKDSSSSAIETIIEKLPANVQNKVRFLRTRDERAAYALEIIGPAAAAAIPRLIEKMGDFVMGPDAPNPFVLALEGIGPKSVVPLAKALRHPELNIRCNALIVLAGFGTNSIQALPDILKVDGQTSDERIRVVHAISQIERVPEIAVPLGYLSDASSDVQYAAIDALSTYGTAARDAVPKLKEIANTGGNEVAELAAETVKKINRVSSAQSGIK
jgi:HEAT repeat protein